MVPSAVGRLRCAALRSRPQRLVRSGANWQHLDTVELEVAYVGNKGTHLQTSSEYNIPLPGPGNIQGRRPYPQWGVLDYKIWGGSSTYHSLQAKIEKRFSGGMSFLGSYSFSKCLDAPGSEEGGAPVYYLDNLYRGPCDYDVPHNFVTSYIWELPFGKGRKLLASAPKAVDFLIGGWQWQRITTPRSCVPYSISINVDRANRLVRFAQKCGLLAQSTMRSKVRCSARGKRNEQHIPKAEARCFC